MPEKYNTTERSSILEQSIHMLLVNCVIFFDIEKNTQFMKMLQNFITVLSRHFKIFLFPINLNRHSISNNTDLCPSKLYLLNKQIQVSLALEKTEMVFVKKQKCNISLDQEISV